MRPVKSLPTRLMTATLKTKLEKIVKTPAMPETYTTPLNDCQNKHGPSKQLVNAHISH